ncbi:hypothetical protein D3C75_793300 [compost metagenome]
MNIHQYNIRLPGGTLLQRLLATRGSAEPEILLLSKQQPQALADQRLIICQQDINPLYTFLRLVRDHTGHQRAVTLLGINIQLALQCRETLLHTGEAEAVVQLCSPLAVILNLQHELGRIILQNHPDGAGLPMPAGIGQCLLQRTA